MEKVNQWMSLLANLGVLVGIGFLIVEIEQNTRAQNGATMQAFVTAAAESNTALSTSADLMAIIVRGDSDGIDALSDIERRRYLSLATQVFQSWEALYLQTVSGTIEESFWASKRPGLAGELSKRGVRDFWSLNAQLWFDTRFQVEIGAIAEEAGIPLDQP